MNRILVLPYVAFTMLYISAREVSLLTNGTAGDEMYNASLAMSDQMMTLPPKYMASKMGQTSYQVRFMLLQASWE